MKFFNRKKKKKTTRKKGSLSKKTPAYLLKILPFIIIIVVFLIVAKILKDYVQSSEYFQVKEVAFYIDGNKATSELKSKYKMDIGSNIFSVDLNYLQRRLKKEHPEALGVWAWRLLPNKIVIEILQRKPIAQAFHAGKYYLIDTEGVILTAGSGLQEKDLCLLIGVEGKTGRVARGRKCWTDNFKEAMKLLQAVERSPSSKYLQECTIDCTDTRNMLLFTNQGLEIRMGKEDYKRKLAHLARAFNRLKNEAEDVRYVDLRFEDVIIGPKLNR